MAIKETLKKNSPAILTGLGITCGVAATVTGIMATPKALIAIEDCESDDVKDKVKAAWKYYIPSAALTIASVTCLVFSHKISNARAMAAGALCEAAEFTAKEYRAKLKESMDEKEFDEFDRSVRERRDEIANKPQLLITGNGNELIFDAVTGQKFYGDRTAIANAVGHVNSNVTWDNEVTLNDFLYEIGEDECKLGYEFGFTTDQALDISYGSTLINGEPCIQLNYTVTRLS